VVSVTPRPRFTPGKGPPVPIVQEAEWASESVWTQRLEEKLLASAGDRTLVVQVTKPKHYSFTMIILRHMSLKMYELHAIVTTRKHHR
jgi:hypothetical protein